MTDDINFALELSKGVIKTCHCSVSGVSRCHVSLPTTVGYQNTGLDF